MVVEDGKLDIQRWKMAIVSSLCSGLKAPIQGEDLQNIFF